MNRELLERPFAPEQIRQRKGRNGVLDYVEGHSVIQRLNEALEGAWSFEIVHHEIREEEVVVIGRLTAEGITKMAFGGSQVTRERESGALISISDDLKSAATDDDCIFDTDPEGCHSFAGGLGHPLNAKAIDMDDLAHYIGNWTDLPVVNRTALSGRFTVNTEGWAPMRLPPPPPNATSAENPFAGLPTIFTVLGKLGLDLKRQEDILPVYTAERIERPAAN